MIMWSKNDLLDKEPSCAHASDYARTFHYTKTSLTFQHSHKCHIPEAQHVSYIPASHHSSYKFNNPANISRREYIWTRLLASIPAHISQGIHLDTSACQHSSTPHIFECSSMSLTFQNPSAAHRVEPVSVISPSPSSWLSLESNTGYY